MKSKKGQALVEFVIILPVLLMLIFCVVDFGRIISLKNELENLSSDAVLLYENGKGEDEIKDIFKENNKQDINISILVKEDYTTIKLSSKIKPITPGLTLIKEEIFDVETSRVIRNE